MNSLVFFFLTILGLFCLTSGKSSAQYFCGRRLSNTLAAFCTYGDVVSKRSGHILHVASDSDNNGDLIPEYETGLTKTNWKEGECIPDSKISSDIDSVNNNVYSKDNDCGGAKVNAMSIKEEIDVSKKSLENVKKFIDTVENDLADLAGGEEEIMLGDEDWKLKNSLQGLRQKRGIISECCDQPCTLDELLTYC